MGFRSRLIKPSAQREELRPRTPGRPEHTVGDTGLDFAAWFGAAHSTLAHAVRDDDPRCMKVLCAEAKVAASMAYDTAVNTRQRAVATRLGEAIADVREIAENTPPLPVSHSH